MQFGPVSKGSIALAFSNLVPLVGVVIGYWDAFDLIFLYWFENIIIGLFALLRMNSQPDIGPALRLGGIFGSLFFCVHYGLFTYGHGLFVTSFFEANVLSGTSLQTNHSSVSRIVMYMLQQSGVQLTIVAMLIAHAIEFGMSVKNKTIDGFSAEMKKPYKRIVVLHIGIILGGFIATMFDNTLGVAVVIIALKTFYDLKSPSHKGESKETTKHRETIDELKKGIREKLVKLEITVNGQTHRFNSVEEMVNSPIYKKYWKLLKWLMPRKQRNAYNDVVQELIDEERSQSEQKESLESNDIKPTI